MAYFSGIFFLVALALTVVNAQRLGDLRLAGFESTRLLGRLEFFFRTDWYPICNDGFGFEEATVACRQLGLGYPVAVFNPDPVSPSEPDSLLGRFGFVERGFILDDVSCTGTESHIMGCQWSLLHNCASNEAIGIQCSEYHPQPYSGQVRLVGGDYPSEGIVQVYFNGEWGIVCDPGFDRNAALAVCRQLGYDTGSAFIGNTRYGSPSGPVWVTSLSCGGSERCLTSCISSAPSSPGTCSGNGFATVTCAYGGVRLAEYNRRDFCEVNSSPGGGTLRLVDDNGVAHTGPSGVVQIYKNGRWGGFCGQTSAYNRELLHVICRQLGFKAGESSRDDNAVSDVVHVTGVNCNGSEHNMMDCRVTMTSDATCTVSTNLHITCNASLEAPVLGSVTLSGGGGGSGLLFVGGSEGLGPVCDRDFDLVDGEVACRQLGYEGMIDVSHGSYYGGIGLSPAVTHITCEGSESHLLSCNHRRDNTSLCTANSLAGVHCTPNASDTERCKLRLADGNSTFGVLEISLDGRWWSICSQAFSTAAANVACRQMGFPGGTVGVYTDGRYRQVQSRGIFATWCTGNESNLCSCNYSPLANRVCGFDVAIGCAKECELECQNGGSVNNNTCTCECPKGYTGEQCETIVCEAECENGGQLRKDCTCLCLHGYTGMRCEVELFCGVLPTPSKQTQSSTLCTPTTVTVFPSPSAATSSLMPQPTCIPEFNCTPSLDYHPESKTLDIVHCPPEGSVCTCTYRNKMKTPCHPTDTMNEIILRKNGIGELVILCQFKMNTYKLKLTMIFER